MQPVHLRLGEHCGRVLRARQGAGGFALTVAQKKGSSVFGSKEEGGSFRNSGKIQASKTNRSAWPIVRIGLGGGDAQW